MLKQSDLLQFYGTQEYTQWSMLASTMFLTDGAKYVADTAGAYWLMDAIASYQSQIRSKAWGRQFQLWSLTKDEEGDGAVLECFEDSGMRPAVTQHFEYTDFEYDLPQIFFYVVPLNETHYVIMLPSEY